MFEDKDVLAWELNPTSTIEPSTLVIPEKIEPARLVPLVVLAMTILGASIKGARQMSNKVPMRLPANSDSKIREKLMAEPDVLHPSRMLKNRVSSRRHSNG
eukprot:GFKZ01010932.1.p2 GENE.GFKZ01010932.1~~GFKZ01010932.1.p2  ORF type:complete len:101 (-),score=10.09 GFKZ01010932.1:1218-1520(-)